MASKSRYRRLARRYAQEEGLDPDVFERQIGQESGFDPHARSPAGAIGIAQIMPGTAKGWGVDPTNPKASLKAAAKNMASYVKKYGSYKNALVAYNAGPGAVGGHLPAETKNYINVILGGHEPSTKSVDSGAPSSSVAEEPSGTLRTLSLGSDQQQPTQSAPLAAPAFVAQAPLATAPGVPGGAQTLSVAPSAIVSKPTIEDAAATLLGQGNDSAAPTGADSRDPNPAPAGNGKVEIAAGADRAGVSLQAPVKSFLARVSGALGQPVKVTTGSNHNRMTTSGNVSDHWDGNAADLGMGGDARTSKSVSRKGDAVAARAIQVASGMSYAKSLALARKGGIHNFNTKQGRVQIIWKTLEGGDHYNHVHVGVNPHR